jgi:uncharacterized membrane protein
MGKIFTIMGVSFIIAMAGGYGIFKIATWLIGTSTTPAEHWLQVFLPIVVGIALFMASCQAIMALIPHLRKPVSKDDMNA